MRKTRIKDRSGFEDRAGSKDRDMSKVRAGSKGAVVQVPALTAGSPLKGVFDAPGDRDMLLRPLLLGSRLVSLRGPRLLTAEVPPLLSSHAFLNDNSNDLEGCGGGSGFRSPRGRGVPPLCLSARLQAHRPPLKGVTEAQALSRFPRWR